MITLVQVTNILQLQANMPLFMKGFREMNKRNKAFDCDSEGFVKHLVGVVGTGPENLIMLAMVDGVAVGYGVAFDDTPTYHKERHLLLWALYVEPDYSKLGSKVLFKHAEAHAKQYGFSVLKAYNGRFNGSALNFFQNILGMAKRRIEFHKTIK